MMTTQTPPLSWSAYKAANPKTRIRNAANELGVSELALLSTNLGSGCTRLSPDFANILAALPSLGPVMALTRNDAVVHEVTLPFCGDVSWRNNTALYLRPGQDTRYFTEHWAHAMAVEEDGRRSLQFFDHTGEAIHKIYLVTDSFTDAYKTLVSEFASPDQSTIVSVQEATKFTPEPLASTMQQALLTQWSKIENVHQAGRIIKHFGGDRPSIYNALAPKYATRLNYSCVEVLLSILEEQRLSSIFFVQNQGAVQSFRGMIHRLLRTGPWFNVLDSRFNLHLNTEQIGQVWVIQKPSNNGPVHSLNVLDHNGNEILTIVDDRRNNEKESDAWLAALTILRDIAEHQARKKELSIDH